MDKNKKNSNFSYLRNFYVVIICCSFLPHAIQGAQRQINSLLLYTPKIGWINDPNGLVYANGIYHMFYQNNPYGNTAANISWGHAISRDLVHWEDKGIALRYNQSTQEAMFSGSAVFDEQNTSGFGTQDHPPLVAIYAAYYPVGATLADGTQLEPATQAISMAYSTDGGENWHFYENNPAVRKPPTPYVDQYKDFRDPKVFWYAPHKKWVMVTVLSILKKAIFYSSSNLKNWTFMSEFTSRNSPNDIWECPDLFELKVPRSLGGGKKWVLIISTNPGGIAGGSGMHYYLGSFDGNKFTEQEIENPYVTNIKWLDYGSDYYAGITWNNVEHGRFLTGWISNWDYAQQISENTYKGAQGFTRELGLDDIDGRLRLVQTPYEGLYNSKTSEERFELMAGNSTGVEFSNSKVHELVLKMKDADWMEGFAFVIEGDNKNLEAEIEYEHTGMLLSVKKRSIKPSDNGQYVKHVAPFQPQARENLRIFIDSNSLTLFSGRGDVVFTEVIFSDSPTRKIYLSKGENIKVVLIKSTFSGCAERMGTLALVVIIAIAVVFWNK